MDVVKIHEYIDAYYLYSSSDSPFLPEATIAMEVMHEVWPELTGAEQEQVRNIIADRNKIRSE